MSERAAFISAILDNPDDDTARLVFADWLQEHGEPERAEFIRCQIEAAKLPEPKREKSKPAKRAAALLKKHEAEWRKVVPEREDDYFYLYGGRTLAGKYDRGFLTHIGTYTPEFLKVAAQLLAVEPGTFILFLGDGHSHSLPLSLRKKRAGELANSPCLRAVVAIHCGGEVDEYLRLVKSSYLINVENLDLHECSLQVKHVRAIADAPALPRLEWLFLSAAFRRYESHRGAYQDRVAAAKAVKILATAPRFASLKRLDLSHNGLGNESIKVLLASTTLPRTLRIDLKGNDFDEERFAEALAERFAGGSDEGEE